MSQYDIQTIGNKVYYKMLHVATINELNCGTIMDEFKLKLSQLGKIEEYQNKIDDLERDIEQLKGYKND